METGVTEIGGVVLLASLVLDGVVFLILWRLGVTPKGIIARVLKCLSGK